MTPMIAARNVRFRFAGAHSTQALADASLTVESGELVALIGPSGCGKTTLLKLIGDLLPLGEGTIRVGGQTPAQAREARQFGVVFQQPNLLPWRSVWDNICLPLEVTGQPMDRARVERLLDEVGLSGFQDHRPEELSGGMQQLAAIARALVMDPAILLMDEPFAALDMVTRDRMNDRLDQVLHEQKRTTLLVTHRIEEAIYLADRVLVMTPRPGRVFAELKLDRQGLRGEAWRCSARFHEHVDKARAQLAAGWHAWLPTETESGEGRGRTLGFPTLNLQLSSLPFAYGVHAARVRWSGKTYPAALHYGPKSTFGGRQDAVEVFLLDTTVEEKPTQLELQVLDFIRPTRKFESAEDLVSQMQADVEQVKRVFQSNPPFGKGG